MADYIIDGAILTDIADAVRAKTGKTEPIVPENMASVLLNTEGDYERGYDEGEAAAKAEAEVRNAAILTDCNAVLSAKDVETAETLEQVPQRIEEIERFPNPLLYVEKTSTLYNRTVFPDGYEINIVSVNHKGDMQNMFNGARGIRKITIDVPLGVAYTLYGFARDCSVEEIVFPDGINITSWNYFAYGAVSLKKVIGRIDLTGSSTNTVSFDTVTTLEEIYFMPNTIEASLTILASPNLTDASIQSIVDGLADMAGGTSAKLTLHATVKAKLTETQLATIAAKNWVLG